VGSGPLTNRAEGDASDVSCADGGWSGGTVPISLSSRPMSRGPPTMNWMLTCGAVPGGARWSKRWGRRTD